MDYKNEYMIDDDFELEAEEDDYIDEQYFKIRYWTSTHSFLRIAQWYKEEKLRIPDLQRGFVWSKEMSSKLIDSILLGIPLPTFFLYQNDDDKIDIIDGLQRIIVVSSFINGLNLPGSKDIFKLSNINSINLNWRGKTFDQLTQNQQDKLCDSDASIVFFEQRFPNARKADIKRYVFERLNTGGIKLTSQEIRNAVYPGNFMLALKEVSNFWKKLELRFSEFDLKRYKIDELILRILTINYIVKNNYNVLFKDKDGKISLTPAKKSLNLKTQMDLFMEMNKDNSIDEFSEIKKALEFYYKSLNKSGDLNYFSKSINSNNVNQIMAESIIITIISKDYDSKSFQSNLVINDNFKFLVIDDVLLLPFNKRTTNIENIKRRLEIVNDMLSSETFISKYKGESSEKR